MTSAGLGLHKLQMFVGRISFVADSSVAVAALVAMVGCGGSETAAVQGTLVRKDGTPLAGTASSLGPAKAEKPPTEQLLRTGNS